MLLREQRRPLRGLPDLLNYAALVDEGVVLNKDGAFLAGWEYSGPDLDSSHPSELASLSAQVSNALIQLGDGWEIHVNAIRSESLRYPDRGAFPDSTSALIDEERRAQYEAAGSHFESRYFLTVTYLPPAELQARFSALFIDDRRERGEGWEAVLEEFKSTLQALEDSLAVLPFLQRLDSEALLTLLHFCVTGVAQRRAVPNPPMYLDYHLGAQDFLVGFTPVVGDVHIRAVSITDFPAQSFPGILHFLNQLPLEYRWSSRFIPLDPATAERKLKSIRKHWMQKRQGLWGVLRLALGGGEGFVNSDAEHMALDANDAVTLASEGTIRFGYYTSTILLMDPDPERVDGAAAEVIKAVRNHGFSVRLEDANAVEAYLGSLPGHGFRNVRRPLVHTLNYADFIPTTAVWAGLEHNPCPFYPQRSPALLYANTAGATPFRLNLHHGDVGHALVLGPTGSGKSTFVGLCVAQFFRYPDAQVFIFEKGYSSYGLAGACGGDYYDIGGELDPELAFCPLSSIDQPADRVWAQEWVETLLELQNVQAGPAERKAVHNALELLAASPSRTLSELTLQSKLLRDALSYYTLGGPMGHLLDAGQDGLRSSRFQVFEMETLLGQGKRNTLPVLLYLFHRIHQRLDGRPTLIVIEEAWRALLDGAFARKITEWLKTLRKANAAVLFVTQEIGDLYRAENAESIFNACQTRVFLPNPNARNGDARDFYRRLGLGERQLELIASATPKRHYYFSSPQGRRLIELDLGPVALSFVGASGREDLALARDFARKYGETWPAEWLRHRGLPDWADYWTSIQEGAET